MADYNIYFKRSAAKDLDKIPQKGLKHIIYCIDLLKKDPRPPGCEKLFAQERYRVRQGSCRIVCSIQNDVLTAWIVKIGRRMSIDR